MKSARLVELKSSLISSTGFFRRLLHVRPACTKPGSGANQENLVSRQVSGQWATRPVDILLCVGLSFSVVVYFIVDRRPLLVDSLLLLAPSRLSH